MRKPLVWFIPEEPGDIVTIHAHWGADFNGSTAVFRTKEEAIAYCRKVWHREPIIRDAATGGEAS